MSLNSLPFGDPASNGDPAPTNPSGGNHKPRKASPANPKPATDAEWEARAEIEAARLNSVADSAAIPKPEPAPVSNDPFDPSNLAKMKLSQDFAAMAAVKPVITSVAVRKPNKHEFVRVRPSLLIPTLIGVVLLTAFFTSFVFLRVHSGKPNGARGVLITNDFLSGKNGLVYGFQIMGFFLGIVALCVFASQTAQEYSLGTLRNILVRQPSRLKVLIGKYFAIHSALSGSCE